MVNKSLECLNKIYGNLKVIKLTGVVNKNMTCDAICTCGSIRNYILNNLKKGNSTSCECRRLNTLKNNKYTEKYNYNEGYFKKLTPDSLYTLGLIFSDGNLSKDKFSFCINLQKEDKEVLEKISNNIKNDSNLFLIKGRKSPSSNNITKDQYRFNATNKNLYNDLLNFGITSNKSLTCKIPTLLQDSIDFWRGMIDGDGCIHINKKNKLVLHFSGNEYVLNSFKSYCDKLIDNKSNVRKTKSKIYQFSLSGMKAEIIYKSLYDNNSNLFIERKKKFLKIINNKIK